MEKLKKQELVSEISAEAGVSEAGVRSVLDACAKVVTRGLKDGRPVSLFGLGQLIVVERAQRMGRNVRTGEPVPVPPHKSLRYKPSYPLTEAVNG